LSDWHDDSTTPQNSFEFIKFALIPEPRSKLHERIAERLDQMLAAGFTDEMRALMNRPNLTANHASMRAVGYRQYWAHLQGEYDAEDARMKALAATRQLAKRQLTWLRSETDLIVVNPLETGAYATISSYLTGRTNCP
jgi:tRNA dimethylallyltransferase